MRARAPLGTPAHMLPRPKLFIDAQHGLCNRLRAMASAAAIAEATERALVVIWRPDPHCQARLGELLDYPGLVIEDDGADVLRAQAGVEFNYMEIEEGSCFQAPIDLSDHAGQDVYIRSAYSLTSPHLEMAAEQLFLHDLRPARPILDLVARVRHPNQVAAHIRMGTGPGFDHLLHESPENWPEHRHEELARWRAKSHVDRFTTRLDPLVAEGQAETIFVAADLAETYELLADRYGTRVTWLARDLYGREAEQIQYALADLLLLTRADLFLASSWSSFSDVAQRLAPAGRRRERSGFDF